MIKIDGFERASKTIKPFTLMSLTARPGKGKTHFALTAPGPIGFQNLDIGTKEVMDKFIDDKEIIIQNYAIEINMKAINKTISRKISEQAERSPLSIDVDAVIAEWESFKRSYVALLKHPDIRTIVWDTGTEVWQLIRAARFGKLDMVEMHLYGPVNMEMNYLVKLAFEYRKNLIVLHKEKPEYKERILASGKKESYKTGGWVRDGFANMDHLVEIAGFMDYDRNEKEFSIRLEKCRPNPDLEGETLSGEMCNFQTLAAMAFPNVDPEVWE